MVQKNKKLPPAKSASPVAPKRRGRPRGYQPEIALGKALDLFRKDGFAATSLDDLSAATGMNRPSLYGAFGDKRELYIKSYARYRADARAAMIDIFRDELSIRKRLERIYAVALDIYLSGEAGPRGCFTVMTAASEAVSDPDIRAMVLEGLSELDKAFAACFRIAREKGELPPSADPHVLAQLASATLHTVAIRARARVPRKELEAIVKGAIDVMVGAAPGA
jgi:AcrR family transcriptional regulator